MFTTINVENHNFYRQAVNIIFQLLEMLDSKYVSFNYYLCVIKFVFSNNGKWFYTQFRIILVPYVNLAVNGTHGGALPSLMSGDIQLTAVYMFLLEERLPYLSTVTGLKTFKYGTCKNISNSNNST